jgi:hypothetical protein
VPEINTINLYTVCLTSLYCQSLLKHVRSRACLRRELLDVSRGYAEAACQSGRHCSSANKSLLPPKFENVPATPPLGQPLNETRTELAVWKPSINDSTQTTNQPHDEALILQPLPRSTFYKMSNRCCVCSQSYPCCCFLLLLNITESTKQCRSAADSQTIQVPANCKQRTSPTATPTSQLHGQEPRQLP